MLLWAPNMLRSCISPSARCRAVLFSWSSGLSPGDTQVPCTKARGNFKGGKFLRREEKKKEAPDTLQAW